MAMSAPSEKGPSGWADHHSTDSGIDTKELEIGITGINLSSFTGTGNRPPTLSGSSVSTNPDGTHSRQHSFSSFNGNADYMGGHRGTPPSPSSPMTRGQSMPTFGNQSRPPGLGGPFPSPIGKSGSVNSTSVSSPHLSLTPSSSVDGNSEVFVTGKHTSFASEGSGSFIPSYPDQLTETGRNIGKTASAWGDSSVYNNSGGAFGGFGDYRSGLASSMDNEEHDDDGLMGLVALRERAHSSPGPVMRGPGFGGSHLSSSPPVRPDAPSFRMSGSPQHMEGGSLRDDSSTGNRSYPSDPRRVRRDGQGKAVSRPPLSGSAGASHSLYQESSASFGSSQGDRSQDWTDAKGRSLSLGTMNTRDLFNMSYDGNDLRQNENYRIPPHLDQAHAQKFGSLPSLVSHVHQQQRVPQLMQPQLGGLEPPVGHVRSYSQPGPGVRDSYGVDHALEYSPARGDSRYYADEGESLHSGVARGDAPHYIQHGPPPGHLARSVSAGNNLPQMRNSGLSRQSAGAFEEPRMGRRNSHSGAMSQYSHHRQPDNMHHSLPRRDDFQDNRSFSQGGAMRPIIATREEMEMFGVYANDRQGYNTGVHNRHHSDGGGTLTAALSQGNRDMRGAQGHFGRQGSRSSGSNSPSSSLYGHSPAFDDDQLAGEYIDDPDEDVGLGSHSDMYGANHQHMSASYGVNDQMQQRGHNSRHSFSSIEQMQRGSAGRHYNPAETQHQPTAGHGGGGPRVVYTVKFKRTQRNFVAGPRLDRDLDIGSYVKVEADRGEDLGIVVGKMSTDKSGRSSFRSVSSSGGDLGAPPPSSLSDLKRVIRLATHDEVNLLAVKREEEEELLDICRTKVRQRALPMNVVDAEYQFDRHKLTFFFEAEGRVDFRELVRDLFSIYKTRIWMQQLDKNVSGGANPGAFGSAGDGGAGSNSGSVPHDKERS